MDDKKNIKVNTEAVEAAADKIIEDSFAESLAAAAEADAESVAALSPEPESAPENVSGGADDAENAPMPHIDVVREEREPSPEDKSDAEKKAEILRETAAAEEKAEAGTIKAEKKPAARKKPAAAGTAKAGKAAKPRAAAEEAAKGTEDKPAPPKKKITAATGIYKPKDVMEQTAAQRMKDKATKEADPRSIAAKQEKLKASPVGKKKVSEANSGLKLLYQPVFEPAKNLLIGFECLLRIYDVELGVLTPGMFLEVAQKDAKLIKRLEIWSVEEVLRSAKKLKDQNLQILSVNISTKHFFDSDFVETISRLIEKAEMRPQNIYFEFREEVLFGPYLETVNKFAALQALGIKIAIDDFGTNYFAGEKKPDFKLDMVKLPFAIVKQFMNDRKAKSLVRIILAYARQKKIDIIALGVETKAQEEALLKLGVRKMQGYLYSKPLTKQRMSIKKK